MGSVNSSMVRYVLPDVGYEDATGETHYEIKDHLGNLRVSYTLEWCATCGTECQEQTVEYRIDYVADYFAYGGIMREYIRLNTEQERFLSTGNERDKLTGWDYRNARYYDSDIGRFLGVDELAVHPFQIDKSPYSGMWSNPISWSDPSGLCPTCPTAADEGATHEWAGLTFTFQYGYWSTTLSEATFTKKSDEGAYSIDYVANWVNSNNALSFQNANGGIDGGFGRGNSLLGFQHGNAQGGGGSDFSNSSLALDIGGGIYGGLQGLTSSQGYWLGKNGKYYSTSWGGNRHTGSRAGALKAANQYKMAGRATVIGSALIGIYNTRAGYQMDGGQFGYNAQMAAVSSAGSIMGGLAGAEAGALIGAGIGAWFGGVGAIPGAVIGGVIGGFGFGMAGGYYGGQLGGSAVNYYHGR